MSILRLRLQRRTTRFDPIRSGSSCNEGQQGLIQFVQAAVSKQETTTFSGDDAKNIFDAGAKGAPSFLTDGYKFARFLRWHRSYCWQF